MTDFESPFQSKFNSNFIVLKRFRFQLEVPEHRAGKANGDYQLEGHKKGAKPAKRYSTPESRVSNINTL